MSVNSVNPTAIAPVEAIATIKNSTDIVENLMKAWEKYNFYDTNLWDCFRKIFQFTQLTEEEFKKMNKLKLRKFRKFLRQRGVWVNRESSMLSEALLDVIKEGIQSPWSEWEIRDRAYAEEFTSPAIRGFLDAEKKHRKRAEAAEAAASAPSSRHGRENPRPPSRQGKEYSPTSSVASYRKVPSVSSVQHVQTPPVQQEFSPQPVQQIQPPVELASAPASPPAPSPVESAPEPAPAPKPAPAPEPAPIPKPAPAPVEPAPAPATFPPFPPQSARPLLPQQSPRQPVASIPPAPTFENPTYAIPTSAPQQPSPSTPQRVTYTAAPDYAFILAPFPKPTSPQAAVSGCTFYKKGMG